ncbi:MAG: GAF domain-containing protein [bacterium]
MYEELKKECNDLLGNEKNFLANSSNFTSLLFHGIKSLNWVGFYFLKGDELILGPFQGKPACIRIKKGKGVCGLSAERCETIVVENVHDFPGHIACDSGSNSEIVIPLIKDGKLYGVLDIDSPAFSRFSKKDKVELEKLAKILLDSSDIEEFENYYQQTTNI